MKQIYEFHSLGLYHCSKYLHKEVQEMLKSKKTYVFAVRDFND